MLQAITFDFWDTIAVDDSDEPKRAALGLPSKSAARAKLFVDKVTSHHPHVSPAEAAAAYAYANQQFRDKWHNHQRTPGVSYRIYDAYRYLGLAPTPGQYSRFVGEVNELIREIEAMEVRISPDFAPHIDTTLGALAQEFRLGIISDTIHTTGRGLRFLLESRGLLRHFSYFIFSDEVRVAKPAPKIFRQAALGLGFAPTEMVHVGDRESNDVAGPKGIAMRAVLYTGVVDRGSGQTRADAVCRDHRDLYQLVKRMG